MDSVLLRLESVIQTRRDADPASSYVAKLTARGRTKMAQKLGEEAVETIIAALADDCHEAVKESADLIFHLLILLADLGVPLAAVYEELERREGTSGLLEKASRGSA
ncbi:MAG: phosphoribosyl-ATP diphosphatase [Alphaproteobacteria bacterium]|nr:phosphoribosyl-ATP diphosphatase [Alphaproteobacteria bacterium]MDE2043299.1 phosphoribosyl-ATP diphosphatase [Alphaproteobacteria bacterium]MDE2341193.1 phosphoribosyl-ATP diphosphatase [Alphaproteobacteria bacterium]